MKLLTKSFTLLTILMSILSADAKPSSKATAKQKQAATQAKEKAQEKPVPKEESPTKSASGVPPLETAAKQALLIDHNTGAILLEKNADELMHPSSMTKIMTAYEVFTRIRAGHVQLESTLPISEAAWRMGGSKMFVPLNGEVSVRDLLYGIIIQSGNDACVALGEGLAGSELTFAQDMTRRAQEWGATNTSFKNTSGWPDPEHLTTARDLMIIARHLIDDFPEFYGIFGQKEFTYNNIRQYNRNPLLYRNVNCDGLKTGHTDAGGYGLVASALNGTQRLDLVINGLPSERARTQESLKLITWGMRTFGSYLIFSRGQLVDSAPVWLGQENVLPLTVEKDVYVTLPRSARKDMKVEIKYEAPINAPIYKNDVVGVAIITAPTLEHPLEIPLLAAAPIDQAGFFKRIKDSISYLIWGKAS